MDATGIKTLKQYGRWVEKRKASINNIPNKEKLTKEQFAEKVKKEILDNPLSKDNTNFSVDDLIKAGKTLDGKNIGLGREKDAKYLNLFEEIQNIKLHYSDEQLNGLIDIYLNIAYGLISSELFVALEYKFDKYDFLSAYPELTQKNIRNRKIENNNIVTKILTAIIVRIKELKGGSK